LRTTPSSSEEWEMKTDFVTLAKALRRKENR
jgi:hypothetical protein